MRRSALVLLAALAAGCTQDQPTAPTEVESIAPSFSSAPVVTTDDFFATAMCAADIGFNIRFGGERVLRVHTTTDRQGKAHQTIHFRAQDFLGWRLPATVFTEGTADFQVQGGAEMFNIQKDAEGRIVVRIHQGNLVFESLSGDFRVIAHHTIREVPGNVEPVNEWRCRIVG